MIMELVQSSGFMFTTGNGKQSKLRHLKNDAPQISVFTFLYSIYTYDQSALVSKTHANADDLVLQHPSNNWKSLKKLKQKPDSNFKVSSDLEDSNSATGKQ